GARSPSASPRSWFAGSLVRLLARPDRVLTTSSWDYRTCLLPCPADGDQTARTPVLRPRGCARARPERRRRRLRPIAHGLHRRRPGYVPDGTGGRAIFADGPPRRRRGHGLCRPVGDLWRPSTRSEHHAAV